MQISLSYFADACQLKAGQFRNPCVWDWAVFWNQPEQWTLHVLVAQAVTDGLRNKDEPARLPPRPPVPIDQNLLFWTLQDGEAGPPLTSGPVMAGTAKVL